MHLIVGMGSFFLCTAQANWLGLARTSELGIGLLPDLDLGKSFHAVQGSNKCKSHDTAMLLAHDTCASSLVYDVCG